MPEYTPALGSLLGIEGPDVSIDLTHAKPSLAGVDSDRRGRPIELQQAEKRWHQISIANAKAMRTGFFLAHASVSPYTDNRPLLQAGSPNSAATVACL